MIRPIIFITLFTFICWIFPFGLVQEHMSMRTAVDHSVPSGCLCTGASGESANVAKFVLRDACRGKPLSKFGGAAHHDLYFFRLRSAITIPSSSFQAIGLITHQFLYLPSVEHIPKVTLT